MVYIQNKNSRPVLPGDVIYGNRVPGVRAYSSQPTLRNNPLFRNGFGLQNDIPAIGVDARYNAWGHPTGPFHPMTNAAGPGDPVSNGMHFDPWVCKKHQDHEQKKDDVFPEVAVKKNFCWRLGYPRWLKPSDEDPVN